MELISQFSKCHSDSYMRPRRINYKKKIKIIFRDCVQLYCLYSQDKRYNRNQICLKMNDSVTKEKYILIKIHILSTVLQIMYFYSEVDSNKYPLALSVFIS